MRGNGSRMIAFTLTWNGSRTVLESIALSFQNGTVLERNEPFNCGGANLLRGEKLLWGICAVLCISLYGVATEGPEVSGVIFDEILDVFTEKGRKGIWRIDL